MYFLSMFFHACFQIKDQHYNEAIQILNRQLQNHPKVYELCRYFWSSYDVTFCNLGIILSLQIIN